LRLAKTDDVPPGAAEPANALWVFGYGSLMWRPGFAFEDRGLALLKGAHRALCVYSVFHRGTAEQPGLVLGLDQGGACRGVAFAVAAGAEEETIAYLREREQITDVYRETLRPVRLLDGSKRSVSALCYLVDRNHTQYAGRLSLEDQLRIVQGGQGQSGANVEYVLNTVRHLEDAGVHDASLSGLAARLGSGAE
jgi:glutathione-specific gamma-glutamylcyclotransferase